MPRFDVGAGPGFTIEGRIRPEGDIESDFACLAESNDGAGNLGAHLWLSQPTEYSGRGAGCLFLNLVDTSFQFHVLSTDANVMDSNGWQHIAVTYDRQSGAATIYRKGVLVISNNVGTFQPQTGYDLNFGKRTPFGNLYVPFNGDMDEMCLYNRALSVDEVQAIFNSGSAGRCPPE